MFSRWKKRVQKSVDSLGLCFEELPPVTELIRRINKASTCWSAWCFAGIMEIFLPHIRIHIGVRSQMDGTDDCRNLGNRERLWQSRGISCCSRKIHATRRGWIKLHPWPCRSLRRRRCHIAPWIISLPGLQVSLQQGGGDAVCQLAFFVSLWSGEGNTAILMKKPFSGFYRRTQFSTRACLK